MPSNLSKYLKTPSSNSSSASTIAARPSIYKHDIAYLIKPFSIRIDLQDVDKSSSQFNIAIALSDIKADLDTAKIIRLLKIGNMLITNFTEGAAEAKLSALSLSDSATQEIMQHSRDVLQSMENINELDDVEVLSSSSLAQDIITGTDSTSSSTERGVVDIITGLKVYPSTVLTHVDIHLQSISLVLHVTSTHKLTLVADALHIGVDQRLHDMKLEFLLHSLSLEDSQRHVQQRYLLWTHVENSLLQQSSSVLDKDADTDINSKSSQLQSQCRARSRSKSPIKTVPSTTTLTSAVAVEPSVPLVCLVYKQMANKQSPYYRGHAQEISFNFAQLFLSLDEVRTYTVYILSYMIMPYLCLICL